MEKAMAPHSSTLAWKLPWTEESGRLQSMGLLGVGYDWVTWLSLFIFMNWRRKCQPTSVFLPGESQGRGEPGGLPSMGSHKIRHNWSDLAAAGGQKVEAVTDFIFLGSKITVDGDCSREIKWHLFLGRKAMTNIDSILKSRDITLLKNIHLVKAIAFPVVTQRCESWTIKKAEHRRIDAFELWCWRRLLRVPWTAKRANQSILKEINPKYIHWKHWCWNWSSNTLATWCKVLSYWKRPWCWVILKAGGEGDDRGWDPASPAQWTWIWVNSGRQWRTEDPGMLQSMGSQRVGYNLWLNNDNIWISTFRHISP